MSMFLDQMSAMMLRNLILCKFAFLLFACAQHFRMVTVGYGNEAIGVFMLCQFKCESS